ncbi:MAG: M56 family metallopeptidase, partial [Candidatus Eremiobacteraeota bacterium]|nr:M56 family metallopeptidase [Candidatus Eremiobacteraeota bacterium]
MTAVFSLLEPIARIAVATLFNSLWEATLLAIAVWAVLHFVPNLNAATRYAAWCVALVAAIALPLATTLPLVTLAPISGASRAKVFHATTAASSTVLRKIDSEARRSAVMRNAAVAGGGPRLPQRVRVSIPSTAALVTFVVWVAVAFFVLLRLLIGLVRLESLKRNALPLPVDDREGMARWNAAAKGKRGVRLCVSDRIDVPVAVGLFDAMILIPERLRNELSREEVEQVALHELGHLRRADDWTNAFQRIVQAILFFSPPIAWIAAQLDVEREVACDDWVLALAPGVRPYAFCLTKLAEITAWPHRPLVAPGAFVTRKSLSIRVERLLSAGRNVRTGVALGPTSVVAAALVGLFFVLQTVAPSVAFTVNPSPAPTAAPKVRTRVEMRTEYRYITIPARHIHIPARV